MNVEILKTQLKSLRLPTASGEIDQVLSKHKRATNLEWLVELLEREIDARRENALKLRMKQAGFPEQTTLEAFDWSFNPNIDKSKIDELATLSFLETNRISLFLGPPGVGKSHISLALSILAVRKGHRVFWTSAKRLAQQIMVYKAKNALDVLFKKMLHSKLWVIDDWGVVSMNREIAEEIFDLLDRRKYNSAMILTSNRDINEWGEVFPDPVIANATIDRIFDNAKIVLFSGKSYRLKGRIKTKEIDMAMKII